MKRIGGNINATLERLTVTTNGIGEPVKQWERWGDLFGYIDLLSETKTNQALNAFVGDSTHVFVCDYVALPNGMKPENARLVCNGEVFQIEYIDNPMQLNYQLEIFLKYSGWQSGE